MYDPLVGRFLEEDPKGFEARDPNLFRYVKNNPANATDPSGAYLIAVGEEAKDKVLGYFRFAFGVDKTEVDVSPGFAPPPLETRRNGTIWEDPTDRAALFMISPAAGARQWSGTSTTLPARPGEQQTRLADVPVIAAMWKAYWNWEDRRFVAYLPRDAKDPSGRPLGGLWFPDQSRDGKSLYLGGTFEFAKAMFDEDAMQWIAKRITFARKYDELVAQEVANILNPPPKKDSEAGPPLGVALPVGGLTHSEGAKGGGEGWMGPAIANKKLGDSGLMWHTYCSIFPATASSRKMLISPINGAGQERNRSVKIAYPSLLPRGQGTGAGANASGGHHYFFRLPTGDATYYGSGGAAPCVGLLLVSGSGYGAIFHFYASDDVDETLAQYRFKSKWGAQGIKAYVFGGDEDFLSRVNFTQAYDRARWIAGAENTYIVDSTGLLVGKGGKIAMRESDRD
jgi:hypothetical protein